MARILAELEITGVWERGIPNRERIAIKVKEPLDLSNYILVLGIPIAEQIAVPLEDHAFYFGKETIYPPHWIIIYTGPGDRKLTHMQDSREPALVLHWGKPTTILNDERIVPVLISFEGILVGPHSQALRLIDKTGKT